MKRINKNIKKAKENLDLKKIYPIAEAIKIIKEKKYTKFNPSVDVAFRLNIDPRQANEQIRGSVSLPHGTGKTVKIAVITKNEADAKNSKADFVGGKDLIEKIQKENWFDFDVLVATPDMMSELAKIGKILGPKGLMPSPKDGTVTTNIEKTVDELKKGKANYRNDKDGNIHVRIGQASFSDESLIENYQTIYDTINRLRPSTVKGQYILNISVSLTMGPGIKVSY